MAQTVEFDLDELLLYGILIALYLVWQACSSIEWQASRTRHEVELIRQEVAPQEWELEEGAGPTTETAADKIDEATEED